MKRSASISQARLARLIKQMRGRRIAVLGDWMLDRYVWGAANRLSPEAAVPIVNFAEQSECLGGAGNVAANLSALGARVTSFGVTGEDEPSQALRGCLRALGLSDKGLLADPSRPTTLKTRIIARHQQVVRVDNEVREPLGHELEERLIRRVIASLRGVDALVISDYDKGTVTDQASDRVLGVCRRLKKPAFVKPKWSRLPTYGGATVIICNRAEAGFLVTRTLEDEAAVEEAGRALLAHFACSAVIITRGEQGLSVFELENPRVLHIAAISHERPIGPAGDSLRRKETPGRQVFDVTGAGDTVLAAIALAVAAGASIWEAAALGNAAAGVVVGKLGTATVQPLELLAATREADPKR
jgi:rfaE bifunctional protein kinase chain/domain